MIVAALANTGGGDCQFLTQILQLEDPDHIEHLLPSSAPTLALAWLSWLYFQLIQPPLSVSYTDIAT